MGCGFKSLILSSTLIEASGRGGDSDRIMSRGLPGSGGQLTSFTCM